MWARPLRRLGSPLAAAQGSRSAAAPGRAPPLAAAGPCAAGSRSYAGSRSASIRHWPRRPVHPGRRAHVAAGSALSGPAGGTSPCRRVPPPASAAPLPALALTPRTLRCATRELRRPPRLRCRRLATGGQWLGFRQPPVCRRRTGRGRSRGVGGRRESARIGETAWLWLVFCFRASRPAGPRGPMFFT